HNCDLHSFPTRRSSDLDMNRTQLTEKLLDIKREKGWSWKHITDSIGGFSEILIVGALLGQMKLTEAQAKKASELFGLTESEVRLDRKSTRLNSSHVKIS